MRLFFSAIISKRVIHYMACNNSSILFPISFANNLSPLSSALVLASANCCKANGTFPKLSLLVVGCWLIQIPYYQYHYQPLYYTYQNHMVLPLLLQLTVLSVLLNPVLKILDFRLLIHLQN